MALNDSDHLLPAPCCRVDPSYWNGKHFLPVSESVAPYLTFLGSQTFAYTRATAASVRPSCNNTSPLNAGGLPVSSSLSSAATAKAAALADDHAPGDLVVRSAR